MNTQSSSILKLTILIVSALFALSACTTNIDSIDMRGAVNDETSSGTDNSSTDSGSEDSDSSSQTLIGTRVLVKTNVKVRSAPEISDTTYLGENPVNTLGTIVEGPKWSQDPNIEGKVITWWRIDYDNGFDGWSGEDNLTFSGDTTDPDPVQPPADDSTQDPPPSSGTEADIIVSNLSELYAALEGAVGGEVIGLKDGSYGALSITDETFKNPVKIVSQNLNGAKFTSIVLERVYNIAVEGVKVNMSREEQYGIKVASASSVTLSRNTIYAADWNGGKNIFLQSVSNIIVKGNDISSTNDGIHTNGDLRNVLVEGNNIIMRPEAIDSEAHADCIQLRSGPLVGLKIRRNLLAYSDQNIFQQNIGSAPWKDIEISGNISITETNPNRVTRKHVHLGAVENVRIEGNTFAHRTPDNYSHGILSKNGISGTFTVLNNIFYNAVYMTYGETSDHNLFFTSVKPLTTQHGYHLTDMQANTGKDMNSIEADPRFVGLIDGDVRLQSTSPAVDKGATLNIEPIDIFGTARPLGGAWDIGAHERQ